VASRRDGILRARVGCPGVAVSATWVDNQRHLHARKVVLEAAGDCKRLVGVPHHQQSVGSSCIQAKLQERQFSTWGYCQLKDEWTWQSVHRPPSACCAVQHVNAARATERQQVGLLISGKEERRISLHGRLSVCSSGRKSRIWKKIGADSLACIAAAWLANPAVKFRSPDWRGAGILLGQVLSSEGRARNVKAPHPCSLLHTPMTPPPVPVVWKPVERQRIERVNESLQPSV